MFLHVPRLAEGAPAVEFLESPNCERVEVSVVGDVGSKRDQLLEGAQARGVIDAHMPRAVVAGGNKGTVELGPGTAPGLVNK